MDWSGVGYCDVLSAVWTLILTAPIHCRASIDEQVMQCYISPNLFWWTLLLLGWPESEDILIFGWIIPFRVWTLCFIRSVSVLSFLRFFFHVDAFLCSTGYGHWLRSSNSAKQMFCAQQKKHSHTDMGWGWVYSLFTFVWIIALIAGLNESYISRISVYSLNV